jgi:hypothetical protein
MIFTLRLPCIGPRGFRSRRRPNLRGCCVIWTGDAEARPIRRCASRTWPIDMAIVDDVVAHGHRMGIHGFDHSNLTPFSRPEERRIRLDAGSSPTMGLPDMSPLRCCEPKRSCRIWAADIPMPVRSRPRAGLFPVPNDGSATTRPYRLGDLSIEVAPSIGNWPIHRLATAREPARVR